MPTVPQYQRQSQTQAAPVMTTNLRVPENPLVQGIQQAAGTAVNLIAEEKRKADVALSQDALLQLNEFGDDQINNPQNGLITKQGKAALGQGDVVMQNMQQKAQDLLGTLPDGEARQQLALQFRQSLQSYQNQARRYEVNQFQQFQDQQFSAIKQNVVTQSQGLYGDNAAFVNTVKMGFDSIDQYAAAHGWSQEQIVAEREKLKEQAADGALSNAASQQYLQFMQQNGEPGDNEGAPRVVAQGNSSDARGVRNNNPGNIEAGSNSWDGQAGSDGRFAKFVTPEHGIRALGKNLLSYQRQGYDTVSEIVNRWAPAKDGNNTEAYIAALCKQLSVNPDDQLNMSDINTLRQLCAGIIKHENGKQPYSNEQLNTGVSAALGLTTLESAKRYSGNAAFDAASPQQQAAYLRQSNELRNQARTQFKAQLVDRVQDASAAYLKGIQFDNPPSQGDFINAYGYREGTQRFGDFENLRVAGQYIGSFRTMPTASIQQYVNDLKTQIGNGEGLAGRAVAYDHVEAAAGEVIRQRKDDPIQFAINTQQTKPIDFSNEESLKSSISLRSANISDLSKSFGTPVSFLSKDEARNFSNILSQSSPDDAIKLLQDIGRATTPQGISAFQAQLGDNNPTYGALAGILATPDNYRNTRSGVGAYINYPLTVDKYVASERIIQGYRALSPSEQDKKSGVTPVTIPSDMKLQQSFNDRIGDAFLSSAQDRQRAYGLFKAAYAGEMLHNPELKSDDRADAATSVSDEIADKAILYATGGVLKYRGGRIIPPYGMGEDDFKDKMDIARTEAFKDIGSPSGFTPIKLPSGLYGFRVGNRIATKDGLPITVEIK